MSSSSLIGEWGSGLWQDLGAPVNLSALTISGYATTPSTLGRLNNFIGTCYSGSGYTGYGTFDYDVSPDLTNAELAILDAMYRVSYYNSLSQATMGYGGDSIPWTSIAEGDTKAARVNAASIGAVYIKQASDAQNALKYLVNVYITNSQGGNVPRDVEYPDIQYPSWSRSYINQ